MRKLAMLAASSCLLLSGCGRDLAGMPRIISGGGISLADEAAEAARQASSETSRRSGALEAEVARLDQRQREIDRRRNDVTENQNRELARPPRPASVPAPAGDQPRAIEPPSEPTLVQRLEYLRRMRLDIETDQQQLDSDRAALALRQEAQASAPQSIVSAPANSNAPESFRSRFIRYVLAAQVNNPAQSDIAGMVESGYLLVQANCDDFFANAAVLQRDLDISRDMIAPVLSILTGILAIRNVAQPENQQMAHIFNLVTSTELAGISIADKHFLFGAENIDDVRELTFRGLDAAEEHFASQGEPNFRDAAQQLIQYQLTCTPAHILGLTQDAIAAGTVVADANAGPSHDELVLERLAQALGRPGSLSAPQALALWRLYHNGADPNDLPAGLDTLLADAGLGALVVAHRDADATKNPPVTAAPAKLSPEGEAHRDQIYQLLGTFTPTARARLREEATKQIGGGGVRAAGSPAGDQSFTLSTGRTTRRRARLTVQ